MSGIQGHAVNLHTRDLSSEEAAVTNPCPHSDRVICCQSKPSNALSCHQSIVYIQFSVTSSTAICCCNVLPFSMPNTSVLKMPREQTPLPTGESHKQRCWRHHPQVYAPSVWHVVEDWTSASLVVYPCQQSDGSPSVELPIVRELNVAVRFTIELGRSVRSSIRAWGKSNIP